MLVAQITDTHITAPGALFMGIVDTASALAQAVAALNLLDPCPDLVVLTGDLVESGKPEEMIIYARCWRRCVCPYLQFPATMTHANRCGRRLPGADICLARDSLIT
jgi:Icc protein